MSKNLSYLSGRKGLEENLFQKLGEVSEEQGTPTREDIKALAREYLMGDANIYGAATFYDFLKPENKGKKIYLCNGSVCKMAGSQDELKKQLKTKFKEEEIGEMCCLGRCYENSAFQYEGTNYSGNDWKHVVSSNGKKAEPATKWTFKGLGKGVITQVSTNPEEVLSRMLNLGKESVLEEIKSSGLRGRGGAGFPIGLKLESCKDSPGTQRFIVCNADEGDPGAFTDRYAMEEQPDKLILGMIIAGYATQADHGVIYIRAEYPESISILENSVKKFHESGLLGENILDSGFNFHLKLIKARGSYICGEETALLSSIEGQRPEVRIRPPYPTQEGLFNQPTVVNNVETLAFLPYIVEQGGKDFANIGTENSSGTKLLSLDSFFNNPGVYEVDMGTPLRTVVDELGGGFRTDVKALHIGGPLGGIVPLSKIDDLNIDFKSFSDNGFLLGHASIICIPESYPLVEYLEHLFEFTADESCGKCFPCRLGSVRGYELLKKSRTEDFKIDRQLFDDLVEALEKGSLCALGGGIPLPVKNALQYFDDELQPYFVKS